jgi:hypothetical protein
VMMNAAIAETSEREDCFPCREEEPDLSSFATGLNVFIT